MGGCCCCSSRGPDQNRGASYYYHPRTSEENQPLSANHGTPSAFSTGLLVDTKVDASIPDTYRPPPPAPMPYDMVLGCPQNPPGNKSNTSVQTTNSDSVEESIGGLTNETVGKCEPLKKSDCEVQTDFELDPVKQSELELSKSVETFFLFAEEEEDVCPTCLEEYDVENPKIITKCEHHFHLACILEWMERSDKCPVCDKEMIFSPAIN